MSPNPISYQPREVVDLGIARFGWSAKVYGVLGTGRDVADFPCAGHLMEALAVEMARMERPNDHACGFAIFHLADDGFYLLLSRFNNANNLAHRVWSIDQRDAGLFLSPLEDERIVACVWELSLMHFEAQSWIDCVLRAGLTRETQEAYLLQRAAGPV
ncbi:MAG: hypothetical protein J0M19_04985 [Sphingomonadales bacterium]|nr:hypothetical protein [Sphingomonadales bacterium]